MWIVKQREFYGDGQTDLTESFNYNPHTQNPQGLGEGGQKFNFSAPDAVWSRLGPKIIDFNHYI